MIQSIFTSFVTVFQFCFGCLSSVWTAVGNFKYIFLALFVMLLVYRFILFPILGHQSFMFPSSMRYREPVKNDAYTHETKIGFTAKF